MPTPEELYEQFGVSRVLLREVTKTLAAKGMIAAKTRVGTLVLPPENWNWFDPEVLSWRAQLGLDLGFVGELTELRRSVEPMAAALAAKRHSPGQMAQIRTALAQMSAAGADRRAFAQADLSFHVAVAAASGNSLFRSIASVVETALTAYFSLSTPIDLSEMGKIVTRHAKIADAIESGDSEAASVAMIGVIDEGIDRAVKGAKG
jgi:DNA-binding FadR family transcriptional regulator